MGTNNVRVRTPAVRLWSRTSIDSGHKCWEWQGYRRRSGHGQIGDESGRLVGTHRVAYEFFNGPIPDGMVVMHSCDNPPCCNPRHLSLGTQADNLHDMFRKGRARPFGKGSQ